MNIVGIGTDIVECLRIAQMIERHGELFIGRVYTPREIEYCSARAAATQHYAGRWAAKEAVLKAMGTGWAKGISWRDIEVRSQPDGQPTIALAGGAREACERLGIARMLITISHCRTHATAYALAVGKEE
jgi:holo-[acyl-carrier protein] synthase